MGLSTLHIGTQTIGANVEIYQDGSLATVHREQEQKACLKCGRPFKALVRRSPDKRVCRSCETVTKTCKECGNKWFGERWPKDSEGNAKMVGCPKCGTVHDGNKRSTIKRFSEGSRRRLMRMLATVKKTALPLFVTLTYTDKWDGHSDPEAWKATRRRFEARFRRAFPSACYFWRLETVRRKSGVRLGQVSPHYHLLVFGVNYPVLRAWVAQTWFECVNSGDPDHLKAGTRVERIHSRRGVMRYASKTLAASMSPEMGKTVQAEAGDYHSRWWGVMAKENFEAVVSAVKALDLTENEAVRVLRAFRRLSGVGGRDYPSLTTFIDGAFLLKCLPRLAIPDVDQGFYRATRRPYAVTFSAFMEVRSV